MIRFEYKVLKPFSIYKDSGGKKRITRTDEDMKSETSFGLTTKYVDYESKEDKIKQNPFTLRLCKLRYLKLVRQVNISKNSD